MEKITKEDIDILNRYLELARSKKEFDHNDIANEFQNEEMVFEDYLYYFQIFSRHIKSRTTTTGPNQLKMTPIPVFVKRIIKEGGFEKIYQDQIQKENDENQTARLKQKLDRLNIGWLKIQSRTYPFVVAAALLGAILGIINFYKNTDENKTEKNNSKQINHKENPTNSETKDSLLIEKDSLRNS